MSDDLHKIDNLFRKGLEDHAETPPLSAWDHIDKSLDKKKVTAISKKYNQLKWIAAALLVFSIGMAMYTVYVGKRNQELVKENRERNNAHREKLRAEIPVNDSNEVVGHAKVNVDKTLAEGLRQKEGYDSFAPARTGSKARPIADNGNNKLPTPPGGSFASGGSDGGADGRSPNSPADANAHRRGNLVKNSNVCSTNQPSTHFVQTTTRTIATTEEQISSTAFQSNLSNRAPGLTRNKNVNNRKAIAESGALTTNDGATSQSSLKAPSRDRAAGQTSKKADSNKGSNGDLGRETTTSDLSVIPAFTGSSRVELIRNIRPDKSKVFALKSDKSSLKISPRVSAGKTTKWSATVFFSPDWITKNLKDNDVQFREEERHEIQKDERNQFSSTFGVLLNYVVSSRISLQSGLSLSSWATDIERKTIYARPDGNGNPNYRINCAAGYSYISVKSSPAPANGDSIQALRSNNKLTYLDVPLVVKYRVGSKRWEVLPGLGVAANFLTRGKIATTVATNTGDINATSNKIEGLKSMYISGLANITFQYRLSKAVAITFTPATRFGLSAINKNAPVKTDLYALGLEAGINIKL